MLTRYIVGIALAGLALVSAGVVVSTKEYCITVNHQALCPGEERKLGNDFAIDAGFAPNSKYWPKLKPKWHYHFRFGEFNRLDHEAAVAQAGTTEEFIAYLWMAKDYCIYRNKPYLLWEWPELMQCMNQCYEGDYIENPYYTRQYGGDTPDFGPQDHSKKNNPLDRGLEYENFCPDPEPPSLDTTFPRVGQGADPGSDQKSALDFMDGSGDNVLSSENMDGKMAAVDSNQYSIFNDIDPNIDVSDGNGIGSSDESTFLAEDQSAGSTGNLFLEPESGTSSYAFASLNGRSSGVGGVDDQDLGFDRL